VSKQLRGLRESGFVESTVVAQRRFYRLKPEPFRKVDAWLGQFRLLWSDHADVLERPLEQMEESSPPNARQGGAAQEKRNGINVASVYRGRPGQSPALLYEGTGLCEKNRF